MSFIGDARKSHKDSKPVVAIRDLSVAPREFIASNGGGCNVGKLLKDYLANR